MERGSSAVECQICNRETPGSKHPFATISNFGNFRSEHGCFLMHTYHLCGQCKTWLFIYLLYVFLGQIKKHIRLPGLRSKLNDVSIFPSHLLQHNQCLLCCSNPTMRAATSFNQSAISNILTGCCNFYRHDLLCQS